MTVMRTLVQFLLVALTLAWPGVAQQSSSGGGAQDQVPTFRKNVNLVNVFFTVKDKHGALIPDLT